MKILLDADSCPKAVRDLILKRSVKLELRVIFAANRSIPAELENPADFSAAEIKNTLQMEICSNEENSADDRIVELAQEGDIAITRDIPLAKRLIDKNISVMDDRGRIFTPNNINEIFSLRNFTVGLANNGVEFDRTANYGKKDLKKFADSFDRILAKNHKKSSV